MASLLQGHGVSCPSVVARRSRVQSTPAAYSSIVCGLWDCRRSTAGYRLGALNSKLIPRQLRSIKSRSNDRNGGQFTAGNMPFLFVSGCQSYESSEKPSDSQESQAVPQITQEIQNDKSQTVAASGNAARRTLTMHAMGILLTGSLLFGVSSADAVDAIKTCVCLLRECRIELARCITNPSCAANVACLQTCNNRPNETECQIGCGDLFENAAVDQFNECAVTRKGCVPQKQNEGRFPIPPPEVLVQEFDPRVFTGKWFISSGFNKTFDTFDCQLHEFTGRPESISAKLTWRIQTPDGGYITRSGKQEFVQDKKQPAILFNHGNEFLHYEDDWYIVSAKTDQSADDYIFVYYRGKNDAWDGYGGAVVYTRSNILPPSIVPDLEKAATSVGLDFNQFTTTDNTCPPEPPLLAKLEKTVERGEEFIVEEVGVEETFIVQSVKQAVNTLAKFLADIFDGEINFFNKEVEETRKEEEYILKELGDEEKALLNDLNMGARDLVRIFGKPVPIRKMK